jgi:hypothetical protein
MGSLGDYLVVRAVGPGSLEDAEWTSLLKIKNALAVAVMVLLEFSFE